MRVSANQAYQFLFHPWHNTHPRGIQAAGTVANIALLILSGSLYGVVFLGVHLCERCGFWDKRNISRGGYVGNDALKYAHTQTLQKFVELDQAEDWEPMQRHTDRKLFPTHTGEFSDGFDWWMFLSDQPSQVHGTTYQSTKEDIKALKDDAGFMENYRKGVRLVARAWGYDVDKSRLDTSDARRHWGDHSVRLHKMLYSLTLFGEEKLHQSLVGFAQGKGIAVPRWAQWKSI